MPHLLQSRLHPAVVTVCFFEHGLTGEAGLQLRADEERATHLAVQRVGLLWWWDEAVFQHNGYQVVDLLSSALGTKVEGLFRGKGLPQDENGIQVSILHGLHQEEGRVDWVRSSKPRSCHSSPSQYPVLGSKGHQR